jgi:hypothetical protein
MSAHKPSNGDANAANLFGHVLQLVLQRSVDRLRYQVGLDLAPLRMHADADHHSAHLLALSEHTGGEQKGVSVAGLLDVVGLASERGFVGLGGLFADDDAVGGDRVTSLITQKDTRA